MSTTIPTTEPTTLTAGDSWRWDKSFLCEGYSAADGWTLTYVFSGPTTFSVSASTADDGTGFSISVPPATTQDKAAGHYRLTASLANAGTSERKTFALSDVDVLPDPVAASGDQRTWTERQLAAIEAAIEGADLSPYKSITVNGRQVEHLSRDELYKERSRLRAEVQGQRTGNPVVITRQEVWFARRY